MPRPDPIPAAAPLPDPVLLDTNCFLYLLEDPESPRGRFLLTALFQPALAGDRRLFASTLTVTELLAAPHATGQHQRAGALLAALEALPGLTLLPVSVEIAAAAARIRAGSSLTTPDALVLATARSIGAILLTNDRRLATPADALLLDDLVAASSNPPSAAKKRR